MEQETIAEKLQEACEHFMYTKVDEDSMNRLLSLALVKKYPKGNTLLGIHEKLSTVGIVLNGIIRSYYLDETGHEVTKNFHGEFSFFMDEGLVGYEKSICAYESIDEVCALLFDTVKLRSLIMENETLKNLYIAALEAGIRYKLYRENEFLVNNATERYLQFKKDFPNLADKVKQSYLATYLGITPESLSRIRKALHETATAEGGSNE